MPQEEEGSRLSDEARAGLRILPEEFVFFNRQLASMCRLSIPIADGLRGLSKEVRSARLRDMISELERDVSDGVRLSVAIRKFPGVFPELYVGLLEAGESAGDLPQVLEALGEYSLAAYSTRRSVKQSLAYPATSLVLISLILTGLLVGIVPKFESIFVTLGVDLPAPTRLLLSVSRFFTGWLVFFIAGLAGVVLLVTTALQTRRFRAWFHLVLMNVPLVGPVVRNGAYFLFCRTLALLLKAGVSLARALDLMKRAFARGILLAVCGDMQRAAENGELVSQEARRGGFFPETFAWKVAFAEKNGDLVSALEELARFYEIETQIAAKRGAGLVEPVMLLFMGATVGLIVLSIFLPILKIQETLRKK